jgi:signal transduction histidine kinase/FixJ family two-component response regulator
MRRTLCGETVDSVELVLRSPGVGKPIHGIASGRPIRDSADVLQGAVIVFRDVTIERETERQLRQSQKMDAVGQLTGGVAHDFNNILTVIMTTIEILADAVADRPHLAMIARMIDDAADRGAALTQQLLAFARKQPLDPRSTDINRLIMDAAKLLRPTLGEHMDIACVLDEATSPALVDPSQLTTALLNLAINARDAMPEGGKLTIRSGNITFDEMHADAQDDDVKPGAYVMVSVSDTGIGIPEAIRDKVFEPFFTTKGAGRGTGLGLSMVYGFVKQSGGHIRIHSEEGRGTTIKIYLPCADAQAEARTAAPPVVPSRGGREVILVVEDDALVRNNVIAQLESLGYATFAARDAAEAMALIERGHPIDLLFTDVVMPGVMNGRQLAEQVIKRRPSIKVLYTSGYSEDALVHHGRLDADVLLLPKPYRRTDLDRMIRLALDGSADQTEDHIVYGASVAESQITAESETALP